MYPEYIQDAATDYALARELKDCLINKDRLYRTQVRAKALKDALAQPAGLSASDWLRYHIEGVS
jgi:hypothetical protein